MQHVEISTREMFKQKTRGFTGKGIPLRFLQDLAELMETKDLDGALKTNGFYQGDDF
jgi:hypothetical protein